VGYWWRLFEEVGRVAWISCRAHVKPGYEAMQHYHFYTTTKA
jgi:hypothetical protein